MKLLIVGRGGGTNVGEAFRRAASAQSVDCRFLEAADAYGENDWLRRFHWVCLGKRPARLGLFNKMVMESCQGWKPDAVLATGLAPLTLESLDAMRASGIFTINYLTDDPWNPAHRAGWFLRGLKAYSHVFSVRRSIESDLRRAGCRSVSYLPFGYSPEVHYFEAPVSEEEKCRLSFDVFFAGGADTDRVPYLEALLRDGMNVGLFGAYWERYAVTRRAARGMADARTIRVAVSSSKLSLCLVRRANRDGHAMRSYEVPAIGGCMITEDTDEHRSLFGGEGECTVYFKTPEELARKARALLGAAAERTRLAHAAHARITGGRNTYGDRFASLIAVIRKGGS